MADTFYPGGAAWASGGGSSKRHSRPARAIFSPRRRPSPSPPVPGLRCLASDTGDRHPRAVSAASLTISTTSSGPPSSWSPAGWALRRDLKPGTAQRLWMSIAGSSSLRRLKDAALIMHLHELAAIGGRAADHGEPFQRKGRPCTVSQQVVETSKIARHIAVEERDPDEKHRLKTRCSPRRACWQRQRRRAGG